MAMLPAQAAPEREPVREIRPRPAGLRRGLPGRSDERLVQIARDGDERAFETLYERHSGAILRYCRSLLRSGQEAEDVGQEVFVLAISALRRGAQPEAFRPWLYRVAHNACMSHLRARRPVLVADNGVLVGPGAAAEPVDDHREELRQLLDDLGTLPEVQRGALLLCEMDGFSYEQVAEVLGVPPSTVRASIFRARRTLQGLAEARNADCDAIQSELSELADRRGRRARHITSHLHVCSTCRDFRDGLRRRPVVFGAADPIAAPAGVAGALLAVKGHVLGGVGAGGGAGAVIATGGGAAGAAKISAVVASSIALLAGAGLEAERMIHPPDGHAPAVVRAAEPRDGARQAAAPGRAVARAAAASAAGASPFTAAMGPSAGASTRVAGLEASTRARTRTRAQGSGGPGAPTSRNAPPPASGPSVTAAPADAQHASAPGAGRPSSGEHRDRGGQDRPSDHGRHRSGNNGGGGDDRDRSGRSAERGRDDDAPRSGRSGSSGSGRSERRDGDDGDSGSGHASSGSSGRGSSAPRSVPADDGPAAPASPSGTVPAPPAPAPGPAEPAETIPAATPSEPAPDPAPPAPPAPDETPATAPPGGAGGASVAPAP
jgi:RNA polymerase sigma factor (sigma-70 family)